MSGRRRVGRAAVAAAAGGIGVGLTVASPAADGASPAYVGVVLYPLTATGDAGTLSLTANPPTAGGFGQVVGATAPDATTGATRALLWTGGAGSAAVDLTPTGYASAAARGSDGARQVGFGSAAGGASHALLWTGGTAGSAVDLNPAAAGGVSYGSSAVAVGGGQVAGSAYNVAAGSTAAHAMVWPTTGGGGGADLNPVGFATSTADGVGAGQQVGSARTTAASTLYHAMLWTGTAASAVDLTPTTFGTDIAAVAMGTSGAQQVGWARGSATAYVSHAVLWTSSAKSAVDLTPAGTPAQTAVVATATNGSVQVGYQAGNSTGGGDHALLWGGTAASAVDLNAALPAKVSGDEFVTSDPAGFDAAGDVFGVASGTYDDVGTRFAVEWVPQTVATVSVGGGRYHFAAGPAGSGVTVRVVAGVTVDTYGTAYADPAAASADRQLLVVAGNGLSLVGSAVPSLPGRFDIGNNDLDLPGASLATVTGYARLGFAGGAWNNGSGLTSVSAAADPRHLSAVGVIQNATAGEAPLYPTFDGHPATAADVLVRYTVYGDADLSGSVNAADYLRVDNGFVNHLTGWGNGDFNYDGVVDGSDYTLMDNAFDQQAGTIAAPAGIVATPAGDVAVAVPEPATVGIAGLAVATVLGRRRRGR